MVASPLPLPAESRLTVIRRDAWIPEPLRDALRGFDPKSRLGEVARACFAFLPAELAVELLDRVTSCLVVESVAYGLLIPASGRPVEYGVLERRVISTAGVNYLSGAFQGNGNLAGNFHFHGLGTGVTASVIADTGLGTEWASGNYSGGVRATGTQIAGGSANVFRTVATNTMSAAGPSPVTELGLFSSATVGAVTLWDRFVFAAVNLNLNDQFQTTIDTTLTAGG